MVSLSCNGPRKRAYYDHADMGMDEAFASAGRIMAETIKAHDAEAGVETFPRKEHGPEWTGEKGQSIAQSRNAKT